ncbi:MAG: hypothetical protein IPL71_17235 [Anaerolineales bacterium]|uniref:hypothetical protein n=1 Tax=Candidatus Villigracilis proximus TaxID=3140683 RepID=UPI0031370C68|nr:hypothetical protein [Anaerolineales bacterium]
MQVGQQEADGIASGREGHVAEATNTATPAFNLSSIGVGIAFSPEMGSKPPCKPKAGSRKPKPSPS